MKLIEIKKILTATLCIVLASSCNNEYLNVEPIDRYVVTNFPKNESQIDQSVIACYRQVFNIVNSSLWVWGDFISDNTSFRYNPNDRGGIAIEELDEFVALADNGNFNNLYRDSYEGVLRSNYVLQNIDGLTFSSDQKKNIRTAEARFFRAWHYFNLVRVYGDVSIITRVLTQPAESRQFPRESVAKVYTDVIEPDVQFALENLPSTVAVTDKGRLTKGAAIMLMAKVLMTQKRFAEATPILQQITTLGYGLNSTYANNFNPLTKNSVESIFEIQADQNLGYSFGWYGQWTPWGTGTNIWPNGSNSRGGLNQPTKSLLNAFEAGDNRRAVTIGTFNNIDYLNKFRYYDAATRSNPANFPVYRYADALLMLAECLNEAGFPNSQAFTYLNQVRQRAGLLPKTQLNPVPALAINSQEEFRLAIERERRVELAGEAHRWFDLVRTDRAVAVMTAHGIAEKAIKTTINPNAYTNIKILQAIPFREVNQFGLSQNPGWE